MPGKPWGEPAGGRPESNAVSSNETARIMTLGASCIQVLSWLTALIRCTHSVSHFPCPHLVLQYRFVVSRSYIWCIYSLTHL